jgi:hypothetical protein
MKLIGLEDHFVTPEVLAAWRGLDPRWEAPVSGIRLG